MIALGGAVGTGLIIGSGTRRLALEFTSLKPFYRNRSSTRWASGYLNWLLLRRLVHEDPSGL